MGLKLLLSIVACNVGSLILGRNWFVKWTVSKMPDFLGDEMRKVKKDDKEEEKEIKGK